MVDRCDGTTIRDSPLPNVCKKGNPDELATTLMSVAFKRVLTCVELALLSAYFR